VYTVYGTYNVFSQFLSSQHGTRAVPSSRTYFITNPFNTNKVLKFTQATYLQCQCSWDPIPHFGAYANKKSNKYNIVLEFALLYIIEFGQWI